MRLHKVNISLLKKIICLVLLLNIYQSIAFCNEKTEISLWIMPVAGRDTKKLMLEEVERFEKTHPCIDVKVTLIDWISAWDKIATCIQLGEGPDIIQLGTTWVATVASSGVLVDLSTRIREVGGADAFSPTTWPSCKIEGNPQVWAVPWHISPNLLYYRKDIFDDLGLTEKDVDDWESFVKTCKKIKDSNICHNGYIVAPFGTNGREDWSLLHNFASWIWGAGGQFLTDDNKKSAVNSAEAISGVKFFANLGVKGYLSHETLALSGIEVQQNFVKGQYAMIIDALWAVSYFPQENRLPAENFGVTHLPKGPKGRYTHMGGSNLAMFKHSKHPDKAWELMNFLVSYDFQSRFIAPSSHMPALMKALNTPEMKDNYFYRVASETYQYGRTYPAIPSWGSIEAIMVRHFSIILDHIKGVYGPFDERSIDREMDIMAQKIDTVLSEAGASNEK